MITPKVSVLDIKNTKLLNKEPAKKAVKGKGFGEELVEKQKKLKKKDDDVASSADASKQSRNDKKAAPVESKNHKRMPAAIDDGKTQGKLQKAPGVSGEAAAAAASAAGATVTGAEVPSADDMAMMIEASMKNTGGKMSLEGFQMVEPQVLSPEMLAKLTSEKTLTDTVTALAAAAETATPKVETSLKDLLSKQSEGDQTGFDLGSELFNPSATNQKEASQSAFGTMLKAQAATAAQGAQDLKQANIDNMISSARTILKDGGGEMQMVLTPEGLGTVDLKVGVTNGQVSVEIMTRDNAVKKMFEDNMFEIRGALENQNLKIDTFKVGVSENFDANQQFAQQQFDMNEREFARDFMGQFRDERQGFRAQALNNNLEGPSFSKNNPEGLQPSSLQPRASFNGSGRLNVVV